MLIDIMIPAYLASPGHAILATVLMEVVCPFELDRLAGDKLAIALDTANMGEMDKPNPFTLRRLDCSPALFAVPESDRPTLRHACSLGRSALADSEQTSQEVQESG